MPNLTLQFDNFNFQMFGFGSLSKQNPIKKHLSTVHWINLGLKREILKAVTTLGYQMPSEIQAKAIPLIAEGKSVICQAGAGLGKTAVFVIGILQSLRIESNNQYLRHQCLIVADTRELAFQIGEQFAKFSCEFKWPSQLKVSCFFGGLPINNDIQILTSKQKSPHIIIGTPGRLLDLCYRGLINAHNIRYFVIDQCDRLLDQYDGMLNEIQLIHKNLNPNCQHIMVSATYTKTTLKNCRNLCKNLEEVWIDDGKLDMSRMGQFYQIVHQSEKFQLLQKILDSTPFSQAIIFVNTVEKAMVLVDKLIEILFNPITVHSGLSQQQRILNYQKFKNNSSRLLVSTDVFGRGIDIERVNLIINYDFPLETQTYVHRIGRAGRFRTSGIVITFMVAGFVREDMTKLEQYQQKTNGVIGRLPKDLKLNHYFVDRI